MPAFIFSQEEEPDRNNIKPVNSGYFTNPEICMQGILLCDSKFENLYLYNDVENTQKVIFNEKADLKNYSLSPDRNVIGIVLIDEQGMRIPAVITLLDGNVTRLSAPLKNCTEVSISSTEKFAFASGNVLYLLFQNKYDSIVCDKDILSVKISPDGTKLAVLDETKALNIYYTNKNIYRDFSAANVLKIESWSPDGMKLLYQQETDYYITDFKTNQTFFHANIACPDWSENSESILYQKNMPFKMKFVNSEIFVSDYKAEEITQLTNTINTYEMQPVFGRDDVIYFMTYENRRLIRMNYNSKKRKAGEQTVLISVD